MDFCEALSFGPYTAPAVSEMQQGEIELSMEWKKKNYIRYQTSSVKANSEQERELINMSDQTIRQHLGIFHRCC